MEKLAKQESKIQGHAGLGRKGTDHSYPPLFSSMAYELPATYEV